MKSIRICISINDEVLCRIYLAAGHIVFGLFSLVHWYFFFKEEVRVMDQTWWNRFHPHLTACVQDHLSYMTRQTLTLRFLTAFWVHHDNYYLPSKIFTTERRVSLLVLQVPMTLTLQHSIMQFILWHRRRHRMPYPLLRHPCLICVPSFWRGCPFPFLHCPHKSKLSCVLVYCRFCPLTKPNLLFHPVGEGGAHDELFFEGAPGCELVLTQ